MDKVQGITTLETMEDVQRVINTLAGGIMQETMNIWYELAYLRFIIGEVLNKNPEIAKNFTDECIAKAKKSAQEHVKTLFPNQAISFSDAPVAPEPEAQLDITQ